MKKGLVVLFPGIRYSVDCPLLYYAGSKYEAMGYEKVCITGYGVHNSKYSLEEYAGRAADSVKKQLCGIDFTAYEKIVFVSKSIGTVLAPWAEDQLHIPGVIHVLLTPIDATFPYLNKKRNIKFMVCGTKDKLVDLEKLRNICQENDLPLMTVENAGHRLEVPGNIQRDLEIIRELVDYM